MHVTGRALMVIAAVIAVAGIAPISLLSESAWVGRASIPLEIVVLDASTGHPVEGAMVRLAEGHPEYQAATGPDGRAKVRGGGDRLRARFPDQADKGRELCLGPPDRPRWLSTCLHEPS